MLVTLNRRVESDETTIGELVFDDGLSVVTLEDRFNNPKVPGETRIPPGVYDLALREHSPMASRYRQRFGSEHSGMIWLQDVPNFTYVYLHVGNDPDDTDGCILVGSTAAEDVIYGSVDAYIKIFPRIVHAIESGEKVVLEVCDETLPGPAKSYDR